MRLLSRSGILCLSLLIILSVGLAHLPAKVVGAWPEEQLYTHSNKTQDVKYAISTAVPELNIIAIYIPGWETSYISFLKMELEIWFRIIQVNFACFLMCARNKLLLRLKRDTLFQIPYLIHSS